MSLQLSAPLPLAAIHILDDFSCGEASLDDWIKRRALTHQFTVASLTFVVTDQDDRVYGYYAMAAGAVLQDAVNRAVTVSQNAGVRALRVHALHDRAKAFYEHYGFQESPLHPMTLMLRLNTVKS